ncbi:MAG: RdgB/HAM1 family non-canonical purine NTP pyrophosphatase [Candidatus Hydrogenedentes bacterium]|nr:RdgB/HAM1 family non-canonical purine NTP pyrophosphatase [Candidatus Hydrogenedentota bacterium]
MNPRRVVIATGNRHKLGEIRAFLDGIPWIVTGLGDHAEVDAPEEDGDTFASNAFLKARYYSKHLGLPCVADDSGIAVDALNGAPGVLSARYAGPGCTDDENNAKLLAALAHVPEEGRGARFVCCAVYVDPHGREHLETGTVEGRIACEVRGSNGFGYDPLFIPQGHMRTFGELDPAIKAGMSHRSRAFGKVRAYLESIE